MQIDIVPLYIRMLHEGKEIYTYENICIHYPRVLIEPYMPSISLGVEPGPYGFRSQDIEPNLLADFLELKVEDFEAFREYFKRYGLPAFGGLLSEKLAKDLRSSMGLFEGEIDYYFLESQQKKIWSEVIEPIKEAQTELNQLFLGGTWLADRTQSKAPITIQRFLDWLSDGEQNEDELLMFYTLFATDSRILLRHSNESHSKWSLVLTGHDIIGAAYLEVIRIIFARRPNWFASFRCLECGGLIQANRPRSTYCSKQCANNASRKREPRVIKDRLMKRARDQLGSGSPKYEKFYKVLQRDLKEAKTDEEKINAMEKLSLKHGLGSILNKNRPGRKKQGET